MENIIFYAIAQHTDYQYNTLTNLIYKYLPKK